MTVVHLKDWKRRPRHVTGPNAAEPVSSRIEPPQMHPPDELEALEDRRRMRQNLGAVAVVVLIVFIGGWLINQIQTQSRIQACFDYGHRNCLPLNLGHVARQEPR